MNFPDQINRVSWCVTVGGISVVKVVDNDCHTLHLSFLTLLKGSVCTSHKMRV